MKLYPLIANKLEQFSQMLNNIKCNKSPTLVVGLSDIHKAHFIYSSACETRKKTLVITHDELTARRIVENVNAMNGQEMAYLYPTRDFTFRQVESVSREYEQIRLGVLSRIQNNECDIVVASIDAILQLTIPPSYLKERTFVISKAKEYDINEIATNLLKCGYTRRPQVEGVAQFSIRGGILDIYPPNHSNPVRIEFWDKEIDTMAYFDIVSQRRTENISNIKITPATEVLFDSVDDLKKGIKSIISSTKNKLAKETLEKDILKLDAEYELNSLDKYLPIAYSSPATIFDYLDDAVVFFSEYASAKEQSKSFLWQYQEDLKLLLEEGEITKGLDKYCEEFSFIQHKLDSRNTVYLDTFARTNSDVSLKSLISINPIQTSGWGGELKLLCEDINPMIENGYCVAVLAGTQKAATTLAHDLRKMGVNAEYAKDLKELSLRKVYVLAGTLSSGFEYPQIKFALITTGKAVSVKTRKDKHKKGKEIRSITDLVKGDLVVHVSHGIGVFEGINKLDLQGIAKDYIKIKYAGADTLYVPVTQLDLVSKYIGPKEDGKIKLNKLNSAEWQKTRQRVKKAVEDMADELILLYAKRMQAKGFAFSEDTEWQRDFDDRFEYVETDDQLRCIREIKDDMERQSPMDRILCGDVGFGKTEVAMRAAFKCAMDSKQCAILCPTTILAWQHFQSFSKRFAGFPINIELLSRFRSPKQQKEIIKKLKTGEVDIIIGTHRVVQKDIEFKDLGLAIVDEEQRFGVAHKERFKEMFTNVDMLTLSATPIPRTLNMAMSGIRDMSTIEEAPQDRHPVQTYVLEHDMGIIGEAISKEIRRGGQVYYIHNKIETIELCAARILSVVPDARIAVAHGRMSEDEMSDIWRKLVEKEIDVLVCTTIIETGVDVSNCNTLIIEDADHMGLSQLYQLRGRVGRSNRRAFAYFTFKRGKVLTEIASKRLSAIREFTKFGSGFRIAMRDLEIRGAGNILGARQHGHMEAVGYDMYLRLLSEAISEKKGEKQDTKTYECLIDVRVAAHIPEKYIDNLSQRIDVYRKIATISSEDDAFDVIDELIDRFGEPPKAVKSLVDVALLRNSLAKFGFCEINQKLENLLLYPEKLNMDISGKLVSELKGRVLVNAGTKPYISIKMLKGQTAVETLGEVVDILSK